MTNVVYEGKNPKVKNTENAQRREVDYRECFKIPTPEGEHLRILNLGIRWEWVATFMLRSPHAWQKNSMCHTPGTDVVQENISAHAGEQTAITPGRSFSQPRHYADLCRLIIKLPVRGLKP